MALFVKRLRFAFHLVTERKVHRTPPVDVPVTEEDRISFSSSVTLRVPPSPKEKAVGGRTESEERRAQSAE